MAIITKFNHVWLIFILPIILLSCILIRINFQSLIYLILLLVLPLLYPVNENALKGRIRLYFIILSVVSALFIVGQLAFQIVLLVNKPYGSIISNCSNKQIILEEFGYYKLDEAGSANIIRIILPDVVVLGLAIISLILCAKSIKAYVNLRKASQLGPKATDGNGSQTVSINNELNTTTATVTQSTVPKLRRYQKSYMFTDNQAFRAAVLQQKKIKIKNQTKKFTNWLVKISFEILFLILLAISGGIWPSLLSIPYFILFLIIISYWSCMRQNILPPFLNQKLGTNTTIVTQQPQINNQVLVTPNTTTITNNNDQVSPPTKQHQPKAENDGCVLIEKAIKIFLLFYLALHILLLYIYQFNFFQSYSDKNSLTIRLLGLYAAITTRCDQPANFSFNQLKFQQITYPFILIIFYWILKFESAYIKNLKDENEDIDKIKPVCTKPRLNNQEREDNVTEAERQNLFQDEVNQEQQAIFSIIRDPTKIFSSSTENNNSQRYNTFGPYFDTLRTLFNAFIRFLVKQSYLLSLLTMMAWSITYHSILTFIFLISACLIWVLPKSRKWCLILSPLFLLYGIVLLCLQFVYGMQLNNDELIEYKQVGLVRYSIPCLHLLIKIAYMLPFWLTLRQNVSEMRKRKTQNIDFTINGSNSTLEGTIFGIWIYGLCIKYWIFVSTGMLLLMSCQNEVVAYRIVYMVLFLYFITVFQFFYKFWRLSIYVFHFIVVLYSMIVLLLLYVFQFDEVYNYVKTHSGLDDNALKSIGFEKFEQTDELVLRLLTPTTFLIVNILQINYFNKPWLEMTEVKENLPGVSQNYLFNIVLTVEQEAEQLETTFPKTIRSKIIFAFKLVFKLFKEKKNRINFYVWRLCEIHIYKIILIIVACLSLVKINLFNALIFSLLIFSLLLDRIHTIENRIQTLFSAIIQLLVCLLTILSMIYQLSFINNSFFYTICNSTDNQTNIDPYLTKPRNNLEYIGLKKDNNIGLYLQDYVIILLILTDRKSVV